METVEELRKKLGAKTDKELSEMLGVGQTAVSNWREAGKVSARASVRAAEIHKEKTGGVGGEGFTLIPLYDVAASAGGGALVGDETMVDKLAFKEEWIRYVLRVKPENLALISTTGDSMEPTLHAGDIIMLDRSVVGIVNNGIYVLQIDGTLMVKRIQRMVDGRIIIKSDNATYETETVSGDMVSGLCIVGRVVWAGRQF